MTAKTSSEAQGTIAPFIFLSNVLRDYGSCRVRLKRSPENMNGVEIESQISFGEFLADEVEKFEICLFDVHDLSVISGLELDEVIQYLRNLGKPVADSIAIETGRDYCLDGQKIVQAVGSIKTTLPSSTTSIRRTPTGGAKSSLIKMGVEPKKNENIDEWTGVNEPLSFEFLQLKLVQGRMAAKREKEYGASSGKGPAAQAAKRAAKRGLPLARTRSFRIAP